MERHFGNGHRSRIREQYLRSGLNGMSMQSIVEMLLFFPIKRKDTKRLAYSLKERFNSLDLLLSAKREELLSVDGIGESAADFLRFFGEVADKCLAGNNERLVLKNSLLPDLLFIKKSVRSYYENSKSPRLDLMLLDNSYSVISTVGVCENFSGVFNDEVKEIITLAISKGASGIIVLQYHKEGGYLPRENEAEFAKELAVACRNSEIKLYDYVIADSEGTFALSADYRYCRIFE